MKKNLVLMLGLCAAVMFTGCKSRESAYRQAYEQAMAQDNTRQNEQQVVQEQTNVAVTPVTPPVTTPPATTTTVVTEDHSDVREIQGEMAVVSGSALKTYSVVVGSFITQANAEGLKARLQGQGYDARVVKTNETINGQTGWFRVVASSYDDKASAVQSRNSLKQTYPAAWLLYRK